MKRYDDEDDHEDGGTVRESLADIQKALAADEMNATVVATSERTPPPRRSTPMPPSLARRSSQRHVTPAPVRVTTPPYGAEVPPAPPVEIAPSSNFDETILGVSDAADSFSEAIDGQTQVAAASYDVHAARAMMFVNTPVPAYSSQPYEQPEPQAYPEQAPYAEQPAYPPQPVYPPQPAYAPNPTPSAAMPVARPAFRPSSMPYPAVEPSPTPSPVENPDMQQRLARLQALSLERPAVVATASAPSRPSSIGSKIPWILLALVLIGGGLYHVRTVRNAEKNAKSDAPATAAATPTTSAATPRAGSLLASGYIAAKLPITLSATSSGRLLEVNVEAGDTITKGQLLARLNDGNIRAELSLAAARVRDASRQHQRTAMLVKAQAATPADLERAVGAVEVARAEMRVIEQKIEDTKIRSPINGTVLEVLARPGESLTMGQNQAAAIVRIADLSALIAEVDIAEGELKNVQMGQEAEVTTESQRTRTYRGVVREIAEQADRARGTVLVKVDILPDLPSTDPADGSAGSGSGSAEGSGSAGSATPPAPEAKKEVPVEPKKDAKTAKNKKKQTPKEIKAEKAAEAAKAAEEAKAAKAAKDAEAKEAAAKVPPTSLRPGMAVQVRFIAREQP